MANHALLNNIEHQDLKIITEKSEKFGNNQMFSIIFPFEFKHAQTEYPIFFHKDTKDNFNAIALHGFEQGENLFLTDEGWEASYIPLMVEREPFLIGMQNVEEDGETKQNPVIHIDLDSARVSKEEGTDIFLEHGGNSDYIAKISATLKAIHESQATTELFFKTATELNLIESFNLDIQLKDGSNNRLTGFYTINEQKLAELTGEQLAEINKSGILSVIYMVIASHSNINKLLIKKDKKDNG